MSTILPERAALLDTVTFATGSHKESQDAMCVMEAAAYIAGEPWSDHPACVSPVIAAFCRSWNDALQDADRTRLLLPLLPLVIGTRTTEADEGARAWMATDWLVRVQAPAWLDLTPSLATHAANLRALPPLTSSEIAVACQSVIDAARSAAYSAAYLTTYSAAPLTAKSAALLAAYLTAESAADSAALSAADSAAESAALLAAYLTADSAAESAAPLTAKSAALLAAYLTAESAADSAALSAADSAALLAAYLTAESAADSAAYSAPAPIVATLQESAVDLLRRMCAVGMVS